MSKDIDFCHFREIYSTNMEKHYYILLQKQAQMLKKKLLSKIVHKAAKTTGEPIKNKAADKIVEFRCSHLNFRYHAYFEKRVPWQSGNYRMWIPFKLRTWHDTNIQPKLAIDENWEILKKQLFHQIKDKKY